MDNSGFDVELADEQPTLGSLYHTECSICHLVLCNPCETTCCGVYFCRACIEKYHRQNRSCPHCRETLDWHESKAHERLISQLKIVCTHRSKGCKWVGELAELSNHLNENSTGNPDTGCKFVLLECPHCHSHVDRGSYSLHTSKKCPFKDVECPNCENGCTWKGQQRIVAEHLNLNPVEARRLEGCDFLKLDCVHKCGKLVVRRAIKEHEAQCQLELVECELKALGCEAKVARKDMQAHLLESKQHVIAIQRATMESKCEIEDLRHSLKQTQCLFSTLLVAVLLGLFVCFAPLNSNDTECFTGNDSVSEFSEKILPLPANLTFTNYTYYKHFGVDSWISPSLLWPGGEANFYVEVYMHYYGSSEWAHPCVQFHLSGVHMHSVKAEIFVRIQHRGYIVQQVFQVYFKRRGSQNELVTGYQHCLSCDESNCIVNDQFHFTLLQIKTDQYVYPTNIFAQCGLDISIFFAESQGGLLTPPTYFVTPNGSLCVELSLKYTDGQYYVSLDIHQLPNGIKSLTFSFYLISGGILSRNITIQESIDFYEVIVLSHSDFSEQISRYSCVAFEMSSFELESSV